MGDLVLPATMFLRHDDIYQAVGHSHSRIGLAASAPPNEAMAATTSSAPWRGASDSTTRPSR